MSKTTQIICVCPNCGNTTWLSLEGDDYECLSCGDVYSTEDMYKEEIEA